VAYPLFLARLLVRTGMARLLPSVQHLADGGGAFLHYYSDRVLSAPHPELRDVAAFLEPPGPDGINLALGAPCFDRVPSGSTKLPADCRGWPPAAGLPELRAAVAEKLLADSHLALDPAEEVLLTQGAAGAFSVAAETFLNAGDPVVLLDPTSPLFPFVLRSRRVRIRWLTTWMEEGRTRFRLDHLAQLLRRARMIVVTSPGNPTGGVIAPEDLEQIAWWAKRYDALIYSDEAFSRYRYEGEPSSIGALPHARRRSLTAGSVSKEYALASARVGWLAGHRHLIRPCLTSAVLQVPFVPTLCQHIALTALRQPREAFAAVVQEFASRRRYAFERLRALDLKPEWPTGAFFLWMPVWQLGLSGREFAEQLLRTRKVLVTPGVPFGPSGRGYVRLSYAIEDGRLREGLARLADFVRGLPSAGRQPVPLAA
jgi:aspartate/methionine/tyrosine aminotransferase